MSRFFVIIAVISASVRSPDTSVLPFTIALPAGGVPTLPGGPGGPLGVVAAEPPAAPTLPAGVVALGAGSADEPAVAGVGVVELVVLQLAVAAQRSAHTRKTGLRRMSGHSTRTPPGVRYPFV